MSEPHVTGTTLPHESFGDAECCGCLYAIKRGDVADLVCNECGATVRTVPASELQQTLTAMELTLDVAMAKCPHCGAVNLFPGFSEMIAFTCKECGEPVASSESQ
jgi:DNA-directed RNA polymerase subunit RPC12/RpoP